MVRRALQLAAALSMATALVFGFVRTVAGADLNQEQIDASIRKAMGYLREQADGLKSHECGIVAYTLLKVGDAPDSPAVQKLIGRIVNQKFKDGRYEPTPQQLVTYEAGTDLMALTAADPRRYAKEIESLVTFLVELQASKGSWYYYHMPDTGGDTSVTQYAVLGLWSAVRAGVPVPNSVWSREADWHLHTQQSTGGFAYHPGEKTAETYTMTVNGVTSLCVARLCLHPKGDYTIVVDGKIGEEGGNAPRNAKKRPVSEKVTVRPNELVGDAATEPEAPVSRKLGVLKRVDLEPQLTRVRGSSGGASVSLSALNHGIARGTKWIYERYTIEPQLTYPLYYLYGLERMCALTGVKDFEGHDWYNEGAAYLLNRQAPNGGFADTSGAGPGTSFAILFLSKATAKLLKHHEQRLFGGGLMVGGRGLPTNLKSVLATADGIKVRKLEAPVDQLLAELENPKSVQVEAVQQAIVDTVQSGDREKLIGQKDRLKRLVVDPRAEVRRTAIWALGRCATIHDALLLVRSLDDPEISVVVEGHNALCWLSRRPNAFGLPAEPTGNLPEGATDQQKEQAAQTWRKQVRIAWRAWYDKVRPYSEHDLPIDLP
jgi:hypothetical protein